METSARHICFAFGHKNKVPPEVFEHLDALTMETAVFETSYESLISMQTPRRSVQLQGVVQAWNDDHPECPVELVLLEGQTEMFVPTTNADGLPTQIKHRIWSMNHNPDKFFMHEYDLWEVHLAEDEVIIVESEHLLRNSDAELMTRKHEELVRSYNKLSKKHERLGSDYEDLWRSYEELEQESERRKSRMHEQHVKQFEEV